MNAMTIFSIFLQLRKKKKNVIWVPSSIGNVPNRLSKRRRNKKPHRKSRFGPPFQILKKRSTNLTAEERRVSIPQIPLPPLGNHHLPSAIKGTRHGRQDMSSSLLPINTGTSRFETSPFWPTLPPPPPPPPLSFLPSIYPQTQLLVSLRHIPPLTNSPKPKPQRKRKRDKERGPYLSGAFILMTKDKRSQGKPVRRS